MKKAGLFPDWGCIKGRLSSGFTLTELLITLAVLAILATVAIPNLSDFLVRSQQQQVVSEFTTALALARSEAVKRGTPVTLAAIEEGAEALQGGWRIFVDPDRTGIYSSSLTLVAQREAFPANQVRIGRRGGSPLLADDRLYVHFDSIGRSTNLIGGAGANGFTVSVWRQGSEKAKTALCIGWAGRVRTVEGKANNETGGCV